MKTFKGLASLFLVLFLTAGCGDEESTDSFPFILFKQGSQYTADGARVPAGGQLSFGISAVGGGATITDLRIKRITGNQVVIELDRGMYVESGGLDTTFTFIRGQADEELWNFFIMNENRDTASVYRTVLKGEGSAYGPIWHYPSVTIGLQDNQQFDHYLDLDEGNTFSAGSITGNEQLVDLVAFFYYSSGKSSPTLTCSGYTSAITYYPEFSGWPVRNSTLYDYKAVDNDLITAEQFDSATNDSLLVAGYDPQNVSGNCKFCYTGKIVPFKTQQGKFGMIKVIRADEIETGSLEIEVKIQQ
ncbi:MAG: hypothetical protein PHD25_09615 [Bacteroidales bacterium]|nr:hypothetical protein [Bacteroidales bacterium]